MDSLIKIIGLLLTGIAAVAAAIVAYFTVKWIITQVIELTKMTIETVRNILIGESALKNNDVFCVIAKDFIQQGSRTVVTFDALKRSGESVGKLKISADEVAISKGQQIVLQ